MRSRLPSIMNFDRIHRWINRLLRPHSYERILRIALHSNHNYVFREISNQDKSKQGTERTWRWAQRGSSPQIQLRWSRSQIAPARARESWNYLELKLHSADDWSFNFIELSRQLVKILCDDESHRYLGKQPSGSQSFRTTIELCNRKRASWSSFHKHTSVLSDHNVFLRKQVSKQASTVRVRARPACGLDGKTKTQTKANANLMQPLTT